MKNIFNNLEEYPRFSCSYRALVNLTDID